MASEGTPREVSPAGRGALRSATLIMPATGKKVKRVVTLRQAGEQTASQRDADHETPGVQTPLLGRQGARYINGFAKNKRRALRDRSRRSVERLWTYIRSRAGMGIFKCSISYLLGCMPTFIPFLSDFLGAHNFGKHMTATVTVYFHPARSLGSQIEATFIALVAFIYAALICFTSMGISIFFDDQLGLITLGHAIVLVVFCGGGLGFVGWVKQRLSNPLVNVGCSLTSIAIITILTKEGAIQAADFSLNKVVQVLKMVIMGVFASTLVNVTIAPVSARRDLRKNLIDVTDALSDMLSIISTAFLSGSEQDLQQKRFQAGVDAYKKINTAMLKNVREAKWEHYALGTEMQSQLESKIVNSIHQMAQSIGGLRSAAVTQFHVLSQSAAGNATQSMSNATHSGSAHPESSTFEDFVSNQEDFTALEAIAEPPHETDGVESNENPRTTNLEPVPIARAPSEMFDRFIMELGPSMKSLAYTLKLILDDLPCSPSPPYEITVNAHFHSSLVEAIELYSQARKKALSLLYRNKDLAASRPESVEADFEEVAASCGHFSYSLLSFAEDMKIYLDVLDDLKDEMDRPVIKRSWNWLKFWRRKSHDKPKKADREPADVIFHYTESPAGAPDADISPILKIRRLKPGKSFTYRVYRASYIFRRDDVKFAIKVGVGASIYALPSFVPEWRPFYTLWRGEWGLLSYMLVCSMTIGASNTTSFARAMGTIIGAICALVAWTLSEGNPFALAFFGWLMALWIFYIIVGKGNGPLGRFIMLTYNLSALYAYALSVQDSNFDEDEGGKRPLMGEIVLHRVVAVLSGCLWGMIITRVVWPISARRKFHEGLSLLLLRMGLVWKSDPVNILTGDVSQHSYLDLKEELQLQIYLRQLEALASAASHEFQWKGPFPSGNYGRVLRGLGRMLDSFHAMSVIIQKDLNASEGEAALLRFTARERAQLCSRISHLFQVLASSVKMKFPLTDALPNTESARDRLLAKMFRFRKEHRDDPYSHDEDYALLYAHGQISHEIREVANELQVLYGTLDEEHLKLD